MRVRVSARLTLQGPELFGDASAAHLTFECAALCSCEQITVNLCREAFYLPGQTVFVKVNAVSVRSFNGFGHFWSFGGFNHGEIVR